MDTLSNAAAELVLFACNVSLSGPNQYFSCSKTRGTASRKTRTEWSQQHPSNVPCPPATGLRRIIIQTPAGPIESTTARCSPHGKEIPNHIRFLLVDMAAGSNKHKVIALTGFDLKNMGTLQNPIWHLDPPKIDTDFRGEFTLVTASNGNWIGEPVVVIWAVKEHQVLKDFTVLLHESTFGQLLRIKGSPCFTFQKEIEGTDGLIYRSNKESLIELHEDALLANARHDMDRNYKQHIWNFARDSLQNISMLSNLQHNLNNMDIPTVYAGMQDQEVYNLALTACDKWTQNTDNGRAMTFAQDVSSLIKSWADNGYDIHHLITAETDAFVRHPHSACNVAFIQPTPHAAAEQQLITTAVAEAVPRAGNIMTSPFINTLGMAEIAEGLLQYPAQPYMIPTGLSNINEGSLDTMRELNNSLPLLDDPYESPMRWIDDMFQQEGL